MIDLLSSQSPSESARSIIFWGASVAFAALPGCSQKIDSHREFVELAYQYERTDKLPEAVVAYTQALKHDPESASTWYDLGVAQAAMEQFPEAIESYSKAIELDGAMDRAFNNRAAAYAAIKQLDKAVEDCGRAIELAPDDFLSWRNRGLAYHDLGLQEKAIADYDESIRLNGRSAATYLYRGNVYLEEQGWERSLEDFNHAIHLDENMSAVWHSRAKALAKLRRLDDAKESAAKAEALGADVSDVFADLPATDAPAPAAVAATAADRQAAAVAFAKTQLRKQGISVDMATAPWDLRAHTEDQQQRFVVRIASANDGESQVSFTEEELHQMTANDKIVCSLIVLEEVNRTSVKSESGFRILSNLKNWTPDVGKMKPVAWSLSIK